MKTDVRVDPTGLSTNEAQERLKRYGSNEIKQKNKLRPALILLQQFTSPLILILIVAAMLSLSLSYLPGQADHITDAILILIIVLLSGFFGFFQDYRAEKTIEALEKMTTPKARLIRDGQETEVLAAEVVPGDLLLLEAGDIVAAGGQILEGFQLEVDESLLTGESRTIRKQVEEEVFMNTSVTSGQAKVRVLRTGTQTSIGQIADELQDITQEKTSFQIELAQLGKTLSMLTLFIALIIGAIGYFKYGLYQGLMTAISLAVAAIPEGLPAVVVLALAIGAGAMAKKKALIRRLSIAESIGAINLICTDKTGTLTKNEMTVTRVFYDGQESSAESMRPREINQTLEELINCSWYCNNVKTLSKSDGTPFYAGEQTELAIYKWALPFFTKSVAHPLGKFNEVPFNAERKMMSVVLEKQGGPYIVYAKGAPEVLIEKCRSILYKGEVIPLNEKTKQEILAQNTTFATQALRVMGFAYKMTQDPLQGIEGDLTWIGLQAMLDPPRPEVAQAIADCYAAGIRVIMITGDNPVTAQAIAKKVGIRHEGHVITGNELEDMSDAQLKHYLDNGINIFARTTPFHKLRILEWVEKDYTVAMTGDGVNDALAVKRASVGIAVGMKGTEVTKSVADMVLLDDNFSTIRDAIKQGRTIFSNIRKFIDYLLTCNIAEVLVIFFATLFFELEGPVLLAVQILWINLLTDGLVALSLGADPPANDIMTHPPRRPNEPLINRHLAWLIGLIGVKKMIILLILFWLALPLGLDSARTVLLTGFVVFEFVRIGVIRYGEQLGWLDNKWLIGALLLSLSLHLMIVYTPLNAFFSLVPLGSYEWVLLLVGAVLGYFLAILITRLLLQMNTKH